MTTGGDLIADALVKHGVQFLYTLCGGHISPILTQSKQRGIRIVDVRDEKNAVFAADATARLTGTPGVAAVTAGPGVTNTLTAMKNALLAQSPVVLLGGAAATMLRGRGSLQDIDQMEVIKPHVKWAVSVRYVRDLGTTVEKALEVAQKGVPGPVFVECPIDLLYDEKLVRDWYVASSGKKDGKKANIPEAALQWYLGRHVDRMFESEGGAQPSLPREIPEPPMGPLVAQAKRMIERADKPVLLVGSQAVWRAHEVEQVAAAVEKLGMPTYLASMARGLLGPDSPIQRRHKRRAALKGADLVILAGVPADFRLEYGRAIGKGAKVISLNLSVTQLFKNKVPTLPVPVDPGRFLMRLADELPEPGDRWQAWHEETRARDDARDAEIAEMSKEQTPPVNPLEVCLGIERAMSDDAIIVADGGDFVASAAYITRARGPLRWLDPGVFGTLGVGGGFAAAAQLCHPGSEVWLIYGDGAAGFSIVEFDTFVRHGLPVIAVVGNDAGWTQIARDQVVFLDDDVGTVLARTAYEKVAEGYGAAGLVLDDPAKIDEVLAEAKRIAKTGRPVLVNAHIGKTDFRKGSISM